MRSLPLSWLFSSGCLLSSQAAHTFGTSLVLQAPFSPPPDHFQDSLRISSPKEGQVLRRGAPFWLRFSQKASFVIKQVSLVNSTGTYILKEDFEVVESTEINLPLWASDGAYDFSLSQVNEQGATHPGQRHFPVFVGHRPVEAHTNSRKAPPQSRNSRLWKREPHPPRFKYPVAGQTISPGDSVRVVFIDGELDTEQVQFVLRQSGAVRPEEVLLSNSGSPKNVFSFSHYTCLVDLVFPQTLSPGSYSLIAQEVYPQAAQKVVEAAAVAVHVSAQAPIAANPPTCSGCRSPSAPTPFHRAVKRALHQPYFNLPVDEQVVATGQPFNISFVDGELTVADARFVLRSVEAANDGGQDVVLLGEGGTSDGYFYFESFAINAFVSCPASAPVGLYYLVAQERDPGPGGSEPLDVQKVLIRIAEKQEKQTLLESSHGRDSSSPVAKRTTAFVPVASLDSQLFFPQRRAASKARSATKTQTATMVKPDTLQDISVGSRFECRIEDQGATTETVHFVLRSANGDEYPLGKASFIKGVASTTVKCPLNIRYETHEVVARVNSVEKPTLFLGVVSTPIIISRDFEYGEGGVVSLELERKQAKIMELFKPTYNKTISLGKSFECQWVDWNSASSTLVRFGFRYEEGAKELIVGQAQVENGKAETSCHVPGTTAAGTYTFIVQEKSAQSNSGYEDVKTSLVTLH